MNEREAYANFEDFWENANRRLTDFNEKQARMIWQAARAQGREPVNHIKANAIKEALAQATQGFSLTVVRVDELEAIAEKWRGE